MILKAAKNFVKDVIGLKLHMNALQSSHSELKQDNSKHICSQIFSKNFSTLSTCDRAENKNCTMHKVNHNYYNCLSLLNKFITFYSLLTSRHENNWGQKSCITRIYVRDFFFFLIDYARAKHTKLL